MYMYTVHQHVVTVKDCIKSNHLTGLAREIYYDYHHLVEASEKECRCVYSNKINGQSTSNIETRGMRDTGY